MLRQAQHDTGHVTLSSSKGAVAVAVCVALAACARSNEPDYPALYRKLHPSVVLFTMKIPADDPKRKGQWDDAYGSGMIVASGTWGSRILTAAHVIADARDLRASVGDHGPLLPVRLIGKSGDDDDLALLQTSAANLPPVTLAPGDVEPGTPVGLLGYPIPDAFEDEHLKRTVSLYTGHVASIRNGTIEIDAPVIPGESGGPVFDGRSGLVIGLAESRFDEEKAIGFATPAGVIVRFLARFSQ